MKENLKPCVYTLSKHVKVQRRTFCRTVRRVMILGRLSDESHGAEVKASVKSAEISSTVDPKPGDLSTSRMK